MTTGGRELWGSQPAPLLALARRLGFENHNNLESAGFKDFQHLKLVEMGFKKSETPAHPCPHPGSGGDRFAIAGSLRAMILRK